MQWEMRERYRQMVDWATDRVLFVWGEAQRGTGSSELGYKRTSGPFLSGSLNDMEGLEEECDRVVITSANTIIYEDSFRPFRQPISIVYIGGPGVPDEVEFLNSIGKFEKKARERGLI